MHSYPLNCQGILASLFYYFILFIFGWALAAAHGLSPVVVSGAALAAVSAGFSITELASLVCLAEVR